MYLIKIGMNTESCDQLLRHVPADARVFAVIDATSLDIIKGIKVAHNSANMGRFTYKSLPQGICNSAALWNSQLNAVKNMDNFFIILEKYCGN